jgi:hypothetical protein
MDINMNIKKTYTLSLDVSEMEIILISLDELENSGYKSDTMDKMKKEFEKSL